MLLVKVRELGVALRFHQFFYCILYSLISSFYNVRV